MIVSRLSRSLIVLLIAVGTGFAQPAPKETATYEVYALRYATIPDFPVAGLVSGADKTRKLDVAMLVWLVRGSGRNILVDSGFYHEKFFKDWKVRDFTKPSEVLAKVGMKPDDITDVIITHMHWDHADGADLFPNARVWLQRDEYAYYSGEAWQHADTHGGIDPDDVLAMVKANTEGRLKLVEGDAQEPIPGIRCYTGGKHTYQSQYVGVNTKSGTVILASDNMYLYENLEKHVPIAQTLDAASNLLAQDRMRKLAARSEFIVPGHDPGVFTKFPQPGNGVAKIQ